MTLLNDPNHDGAPTQKEIDSVIATIYGGPSAPMAAGGGRVVEPDRQLTRYDVDRLEVIEDWQNSSPPADVRAARDLLEKAVDEAREAARNASVGTIAHDRQTEALDAKAAISSAMDAGETAKATKGTDWEAESTFRGRVQQVAGQRLARARADYDQTVAGALPAWRKMLQETVTAEHDRALELVAPAAQAFGAWRSACNAVDAIESVVDPDKFRRLRILDQEATQVRSEGIGGMSQAVALLNSDHPVHVGDWATRVHEMQPPDHVRRWAARANGASEWWLAVTEFKEHYAVTSYCRGLETQVLVHGGDQAVAGDPWAAVARLSR